MFKLVVIYYDKLIEGSNCTKWQSPTVAFMHKHFKHNSKKNQLSKPFQRDLFGNSNNKINKL